MRLAQLTTIGAVFALSTGGALANPCKSHWQKVGSALQKVGPPISKLICKLVNKDDAAAAQKCVADYDKAVAKAKKLVKTYNKNAGTEKIGPRGLGWERTYNGTLLAERVFIGPPMVNDNAKVTLTVTGGKWKKSWTVDVCMIDEDGGAANHKSKTFKGSGKTTWKASFSGVLGQRVQVYLHKGVGTNGVQYTLRHDVSGAPTWLAAAKAAPRPRPPRRSGRPGRAR